MATGTAIVVAMLIVSACTSSVTPSPAEPSTPTPRPTASPNLLPAPTQEPTPASTPALALEQELLAMRPVIGWACVVKHPVAPAGQPAINPDILRQVACDPPSGTAPALTISQWSSHATLDGYVDKVAPLHLARGTGGCAGGTYRGTYSTVGASGQLGCSVLGFIWTIEVADLSVIATVPTGWDLAKVYAWWLSTRLGGASLVSETAVRPPPTPTPMPTPTQPTFNTLASRDWALVVKSPDTYKGTGYHLWACITQFDGATGTGAFRGQASYRKETSWFSAGSNVLFQGATTLLAPFVEDDVVSLNVVSLGSYTYSTQIGGSTTVPLFRVWAIEQAGSC